MSEEEILINIKEMINICDSLPNEGCTAHIISHDHFKAVKGLLDLYNKQKEEIKKLRSKLVGELEYINSPLEGEAVKIIEFANNKIKDEFISKDKIREVLEKERKKQKERVDISLALNSQYISLIDKIKKQLLEEK